jgi:hypothetical protein
MRNYVVKIHFSSKKMRETKIGKTKASTIFKANGVGRANVIQIRARGKLNFWHFACD